MFRISKRELQSFRKLQETSYELGGKIILNSKGIKSTQMVNGTNSNVYVSQFPIGMLWFHTHPNIPPVKTGETSYTNVIKELQKTKGKDFTVDTLVQPISDDDLVALTSSIREKKTCMMAVFTPEGIYLMSQGEFVKVKKDKFSGVTIQINTEKKRPTAKEINKLPNYDNKNKRKEMTKKAKNFLKERDSVVLDGQELLIPKLNKAKTLQKKINLMKQFQKNMGKKVAKLSNDLYPYIKVHYYPWNTNVIKINSRVCSVLDKK